jgi:hypothetical protein
MMTACEVGAPVMVDQDAALGYIWIDPQRIVWLWTCGKDAN